MYTEDMVAVKWKDNRPVTVASNHDSVEPLQSATRYIRELKKQRSVPQPHLIKNYNHDIGGVDLVDRSISEFRPMIRWRKFYGPLIVNAFGLLQVAAWRLHQDLGGRQTQLDFTRDLVLDLLGEPLPQQRPGPAPVSLSSSRHQLVQAS